LVDFGLLSFLAIYFLTVSPSLPHRGSSAPVAQGFTTPRLSPVNVPAPKP